MMKKKKAKMKFVGRKHSLYGLISTLFGAVNLISLIVLIVITTNSAGATGIWLGLIGILLLIMSLVGGLIAVVGFRQKDIFYTLPIIGITSNGILFLSYVVLYFLGLSNMNI